MLCFMASDIWLIYWCMESYGKLLIGWNAELDIMHHHGLHAEVFDLCEEVGL